MCQIPLTLAIPPSYKRDNFIIGPANERAMQWLNLWPEWPLPYRVLNIFGASGCGKTHISYVFEALSGARRLSELKDIKGIIGSDKRHFILDDFELGAAYSLEALFHFFNHLGSIGGTALLLSQQSAAQMDCPLNDLHSRLRAVTCQEIIVPDDYFLAQVLESMFGNRQCSAPENVISYMITHMPRNFTSAYHLVAAIDMAALAAKKPITLGLVKEVMMPDNKALEFNFKHEK